MEWNEDQKTRLHSAIGILADVKSLRWGEKTISYTQSRLMDFSPKVALGSIKQLLERPTYSGDVFDELLRVCKDMRQHEVRPTSTAPTYRGRVPTAEETEKTLKRLPPNIRRSLEQMRPEGA